MKRYLITSPKFTGQAELFFTPAGVLCKIDCTDTNMNAITMHQFKNACPVQEEALVTSFSAHTVIVQAEFEATFDMFWNKYKEKRNKKRCLRIWEKMNKADQVQAFFGIDAYDKFLKKNDWRSKADPDTYLNNAYWENEYR